MLIALIGNLLCLYLVFRSPGVQTYLAQTSAAWLSKELNTKVSVGGVNISWFFNIVLEDIIVNDRHAAAIVAGKSLELDLIKINISKKHLKLGQLTISDASINLIKYESDSTFNYTFIADYFAGKPQSPESEPWLVSLNGIKLNNCSVRYINEHYDTISGAMDYNHINVSNIYLNANEISVDKGDISLNILNLSAKEQSGFVLYKLTTKALITSNKITAENLHIMTPGSDLQLNLTFGFNTFNAFNHFIDSIRIDARFKPSHLDLNEIRYFAREVEGMENLIHFEGNVKGKISSLNARDFQFSLGNNTYFKGDITMDGLPDIQETFIHLKVSNLTTDYYDLTNFRLPGKSLIDLPKEVRNVGLVDIKGFFTGFIYDFVSSADFKTSIGNLETDISLKTGKGKLLTYSGDFKLQRWDLGRTFNISDKVGKVSIKSSVNGEILNDKHNNLNLNAVIEQVVLLNNEFNGISINGQLNNKQFIGALSMRDELASLDFEGMVDLTDKIPTMNFTAVLHDVYLSKLNLWKHDSTSRISTKMDLNFRGSNIDNLLGYLRFDSTNYTEGSKSYYISKIELSTEQIAGETKKLALNSDLVDASFYGIFSFADFYNSITNVIELYLPSLKLSDAKQQQLTKEQLFEYNIQIKNFTPLTEIFLPQLSLQSSASIFGSYNSRNNLITLNALAKKVSYEGFMFNDWYLKARNTGSSIQMTTGVTSLQLKENEAEDSDRLRLENLSLNTYMEGDSVKYALNWDDNETDNSNIGKINGFFSFNEFPRIKANFEKFDIVINKSPWEVDQKSNIIIDSNSVFIDNIEISGKNQKLRLAGKISDNPSDILTLYFEGLDVSNADMLINVRNVDFDGLLTGAISIRDIYNTMKVEATVEVKDFAFNKERMGDAIIRSKWNNEISALDINADIVYKGNIGTHMPISAKGLIYTAKRDEGNFDLDVKVLNYKLVSLAPFLRGVASNISGIASGNLKLLGTFKDPVITGELELLRTQMKIDYLNVSYSFADKFTIDPEHIYANNIIISDSLGNTGKLDFSLKHKHFRNIDMNIDIDVNRINGLNTTFKNNNLFYGKAFGTGKVKISGSFEDVAIDIDARSDPNTNVYIPINLAVGASENNFIRFIGNQPEKDKAPDQYIPDESGTEVNIDLQVTRDASIQLFLPENIGNIKGTGTGNLQIGINKQGDMSIYGDYRMDQGSFLFTLGNVINRVFTIRDGSTISFLGSPYEANINLNAVYRVRASMKGLPEQYAGKSIPVDCIIKLENDLYNPDISFSIKLPEANTELNQLIYAAIDTTNQVLMTQQMVSLLVLKTFALSSSPTLASSVGSSSIEMLTDQLSNILSQISDDVDIGVKYRTGDALTDEEVEVAVTTSFFNDRVTIDGNVGMYTTATTHNTSNIVGDVVVDVKLTNDGRFRVRVFNKSNPFDVSSTSYATNKYKQGVGIYYKYEFDKFSEIFQRRKKKPVVSE